MKKEEEKKLPMDEGDAEEARQEAIDASNESAGVEEDKRPDYPRCRWGW